MKGDARTADALVVGGGIIGCAAAFEIARRDRSVVVLEANRPGSGATGAAGGFICASSKRPGPHMELAKASARLYENLEEELNSPAGSLGYRRSGGLIVAKDEAGLIALDEFMGMRSGSGLRLERLSGRELIGLEPHLSSEIAGAVLCTDDGEALPMSVLEAYRSAGERAGVLFRCGAEVRKAHKTAGDWRVETAAGPWTAPVVVIAAGAWSGGVGKRFGIDIPVKPRRGQALLLDVADRLIDHPTLAAGYFGAKYEGTVSAASIELSLWMRPDGRMFVGGTREWTGFDAAPSESLLAEIRRRGEEVLPALRNAPAGKRLLGFRPYSETGLPLIGPVPGVSGLYLATGHEGDGVSLAPITGRIVSQYIAGEATEVDLTPFCLSAR